LKTCTTCGAEWPDDTKFCPNDGSTLRSASGTGDLVGSIVADRYHIEKKLGQGGMGAVYLGTHVKMGRQSAIKVMTQAMVNDPEAIARFNREAANAARINHPNVCAIYDFGETQDGLIYLAMEFIEGESLSDLLRREGALPPQRATSILRQTADALQAAHDLGIVHRDLKPDNIMITRGRGDADVVKVVDFGIAKAMTGEEGQKVTKTGLVVGTPEYMSPEQLSGDVLDGRSDLYSLALVYFRMLTGILPFQADSAQETMIKRLTDDPMRLNDARDAGFPARLQEVLDRALARMPGDRYGSAAEFADDAETAVSGIPAQAPVGDDGATQLIDAEATEQLVATRVSAEPVAEPKTPTTPAPIAAPTAIVAPPKKKPVAAIAGAVAVVAVGGFAAVFALKGGGAEPTQAVNDGTTDSGQVIDSTAHGAAPVNPGGNPNGDNRGGDRRGGDTTARRDTENVEPPPPGVDSAAVFDRLNELLHMSEDPASRATARQEAQSYYDNAAVPANLRAQAASNVGQTYLDEDRMDEACTWFRLASQLDPGNASYTRTLNMLSCAP